MKKNFAFIDGEIEKLKKVPSHLFEDADGWSGEAKDKLDKFEENLDKPNFINYDMLESKEDNAGQDICNFGEQLLEKLEEHKDISQSKVESQINQLVLEFSPNIVN